LKLFFDLVVQPFVHHHGQLRKVNLDGITWDGSQNNIYTIEDPLRTLRNFGDWLKQGFEAKGKTIKVRMGSRWGYWEDPSHW
jgi:hypothetical protein